MINRNMGSLINKTTPKQVTQNRSQVGPNMAFNKTVALKHGSVDYTSAFGGENKSKIIDRNA